MTTTSHPFALPLSPSASDVDGYLSFSPPSSFFSVHYGASFRANSVGTQMAGETKKEITVRKWWGIDVDGTIRDRCGSTAIPLGGRYEEESFWRWWEESYFLQMVNELEGNWNTCCRPWSKAFMLLKFRAVVGCFSLMPSSLHTRLFVEIILKSHTCWLSIVARSGPSVEHLIRKATEISNQLIMVKLE